jgi:hypothetical protein
MNKIKLLKETINKTRSEIHFERRQKLVSKKNKRK